MAGTFVKCVYKFDAEVDGDLALEVGDVVHVTQVVSDDWYQGTLNGKSGQFPKAFVEETTDRPAKPIDDKPKGVFDVAIAVSSFTAEQDGDLALNQGEVVVITEVIDENWAIGYTHGGNKGSFPRAFVKQISFEDSAMKDALQAAVPSFQSEITELDEEDNELEAEEKYLVIEPFSAQSDTELNLVKGVFVEVIDVFDDFWLDGKLENGKTGIFPRTCIDFPEDKLPLKDDEDDKDIPQTPEEVVTEEHREEDSSKSSSTDFFVVAVFDYNSSVEGDLNFVTGDCIKVTKVIDGNWYQGELSGNEGVFPSNHVETASPEEPQHKITKQTSDNNQPSIPVTTAENIEDELSDNESFPPPPSEDVLSDLEETHFPETHLEESNQESSVEVNNDLNNDTNIAPAKETPPSKLKPAKKPPPSRPASGPKKPDKPKVQKQEIDTSISSNSNEENDVPEKPKMNKKKPPPERPKMPALKKDILPPFSYKFDTESQPTVIIAGKYVKQGQPNVIILRKS